MQHCTLTAMSMSYELKPVIYTPLTYEQDKNNKKETLTLNTCDLKQARTQYQSADGSREMLPRETLSFNFKFHDWFFNFQLICNSMYSSVCVTVCTPLIKAYVLNMYTVPVHASYIAKGKYQNLCCTNKKMFFSFVLVF